MENHDYIYELIDAILDDVGIVIERNIETVLENTQQKLKMVCNKFFIGFASKISSVSN